MYKELAIFINNTLKYKEISLCFFLCFLCFGCIRNTDLVGYTFKNKDLSTIKPGKTSQQEIINLLGSPSTYSTYGNNSWYYIATEQESIAFFSAKIKQQKIVEITFDKKNIVNDVKEYSEKDASKIKIVNDKTLTEGHDIGIMGQLLGNIGRFNSEPGKPKITKPRSVPR